jgi:glycerol-1-phosphate dehydrogenase [NAD(P)+]
MTLEDYCVRREELVSEALLKRAMHPPLEFGHGLLAEKSADWGRYLLITAPPVWSTAEKMLRASPAQVLFVESMDRGGVERIEQSLGEFDTIVGIGGGMALDLAKYVAWKRGQEPVLAPSIASVDACVTNSIAVRDENKVRYIGFVVPRAVLSDFGLMQSAPPGLNRAGVGDLLSIHTGRWDWELAGQSGEVAYDPEIGRAAARIVADLDGMAEEIMRVSETALQWLIESYAKENELCLQAGHSRPEEGSEHFFAYNLERLTRRSFVHGELVCLGVVLMSRLQGNEPERAEELVRRCGARYHPRGLGLSRREVEEGLLSLAEFCRREKLFHSIIDERPLDAVLAHELVAGLEFG